MKNKKLGYFTALLTFFKGIVGAGIFSMGSAFQLSGMAIGISFTVLVGLLVLHCQHLLVASGEFVKERIDIDNIKNKKSNSEHYDLTSTSDESIITDELKQTNYGSVVEYIFEGSALKKWKKAMKIFVNTFISLQHTGFCCVYVVFISKNLGKFLEKQGVYFDVKILILIFTFPIWMLSLLTNLKILAPVTITSSAILLSGVGITFNYIFTDLPSITSVDMIRGWKNLPVFFGMVLFVYENIGSVLPLRAAMKNPDYMKHPVGILNIGFILCGTLITSIGALAFQKYGEDLKDSVTLNLPATTLVDVVNVLIAVQVILSYPVHLYVPVSVIWPLIEDKKGPFKRPLLLHLLFRSCLVLITVLVGIGLPFIDLLVALVGVICSPTLTLVIPCILDIIRSHNSETTLHQRFRLIKNGVIIIFAIFVFVTGLYQCTIDIIESF